MQISSEMRLVRHPLGDLGAAASYAVSLDSTEAPAIRIQKPHIYLHNLIRMDENLNLSGARFKKRCGFGERIHRFYVCERTVRVKKKKKNGCSKNIRICGTWLDCPWVPKNFNEGLVVRFW